MMSRVLTASEIGADGADPFPASIGLVSVSSSNFFH